MSTHADRVKIIKKIEEIRSSKVLVYFTGDRQGRETQIAEDIVPLMFQHLEKIGDQKKIDLFLYTRGGILIVPWRIVSLIREYTTYFSVLAPFRCHSAGTLIALGANEIIMTKLAELSPVDPQINKLQEPGKPVVQRSVEDFLSYISFAKEKVGITSQDQLGSVLTNLFGSKDFSALDVGNVHRSHSLIRLFARKLLSFHMKTAKEEAKIKEIIEVMTEKLFAHEYKINRIEANQIGLKVNNNKKNHELNQQMMNLYEEYRNLMELDKPWNLQGELGNEREKKVVQIRASIESETLNHQFVSELEIKTTQMPAQFNLQNIPPGLPPQIVNDIARQVAQQIPALPIINVTVLKEGWIENMEVQQ